MDSPLLNFLNFKHIIFLDLPSIVMFSDWSFPSFLKKHLSNWVLKSVFELENIPLVPISWETQVLALKNG